ncbi:hypothetical protein HN935_03555 [archaeon]|mgnify:CR=1 FL=1|jgi:hypothetical protein|nr:hypothetical protein [archaeon]
MIKSAGVLFLVFVLVMSFGLVVAEDASAPEDPSATGVPNVAGVPGVEELEKTKEIIDKVSPVNEEGDLEFEKFTPYKSWAEERLVSVNKYVGWFSKLLLGVELSLSWIFVFSIVLFILLFVIVYNSINGFFNSSALFSAVFAFIVSILGMQGMGKDFVVWVDSVATTWWLSAIVILFGIIVGFIYAIFAKTIGKKFIESRKAAQSEDDKKEKELFRAQAELIRENLGI